jgi:hypothetical protein
MTILRNQSSPDLIEQLRALDEACAQSKPAAGTSVQVPDGIYSVTVENVEFKTSKAGNPMLAWTFKIEAGPHKGLRIWNHSMLKTEANARFLRRDLEACGIQLVRLSDLPSCLGDLIDLKLVVEKTTNGDFHNVEVKSRVPAETTKSASQKEAQPAQPPEFGAVPF